MQRNADAAVSLFGWFFAGAGRNLGRGLDGLCVWAVLIGIAVQRCAAGSPATRAALERHVTFAGAVTSESALLEQIARATGLRIVAPGCPGEALPADLVRYFAGKEMSASDALTHFQQAMHYTGQLEDSMYTIARSPMVLSSRESDPVFVRTAGALGLISSLTRKQISDMIASGLVTSGWLLPNQRQRYVDFVRAMGICKNAWIGHGGLVTAGEIMAAPIRFEFSYTASCRLINERGGESAWVGLFNYETGLLIHRPGTVVSVSPRRYPGVRLAAALVRNERSGHAAVARSPTELVFSGTVRIDVAGIRRVLTAAAGKPLYVDSRAQHLGVIVTKGHYPRTALVMAVALACGLQVRRVGRVLFLGEDATAITDAVRRKLGAMARAAERNLARRPLDSRVPFTPGVFSAGVSMPFTALDVQQQVFIKKMLAATDEPFESDKFDLTRCRIQLANTLWMQALCSMGGSVQSEDVQIQ